MTVLLFNDCYIILKNDDKRRKIRFSTDCNHHCTGRSLYVSRYIRLRGFFSSFSSSLLLSVHLDSSPSASRLFSLTFSFCCSFFHSFSALLFFLYSLFSLASENLFFLHFHSVISVSLGENAHWGRTAMNGDVNTGPLARPFARLTRLLALHCSLCLRAPLHFFFCSLAHFAHSLARGKVND